MARKATEWFWSSGPVANIYVPHWDGDSEDWRRALLGAQAGCEQIGISLYELAPGQRMVFHYHLQNEEALIVLAGRPTLRTSEGEQELDEGSIVGFPRGERGAHGFSNQTDQPVRVLVVSELNAPNVSDYPDTRSGSSTPGVEASGALAPSSISTPPSPATRGASRQSGLHRRATPTESAPHEVQP